MSTVTVAAGKNTFGNAADLLWSPTGIFVDINYDLYIADYGDHRIQLFELGQTNGRTVAGQSSVTTTIDLNGPTGIVLDGDGYLFIEDKENHRIVGSRPNGFRCLVGYLGSGSASNQSHSIVFGRSGNMFVIDQYNNRIQQFFLLRKFMWKV